MLAPLTGLVKMWPGDGRDTGYQDDKRLKPDNVPADEAGGAG